LSGLCSLITMQHYLFVLALVAATKPDGKMALAVTNATTDADGGDPQARLEKQLEVQQGMLSKSEKDVTSLQSQVTEQEKKATETESALAAEKKEVATASEALRTATSPKDNKALKATVAAEDKKVSDTVKLNAQLNQQLNASDAQVDQLKTSVSNLRASTPKVKQALVSVLEPVRAAMAVKLDTVDPDADMIVPEKGLPEQGYAGEDVVHKDGQTTTADWGGEYGPVKKKSSAAILGAAALLLVFA